MRDPRHATVAVQALDQLTDFAAVLDGVGNVVYANPFVLELLGWTETDLVGTSIADHVHPDDLLRAMSVIDRINDEEGLGTLPVTPAFYRLRRKDGAWFRIELNATVVENDDADVGDHIVIFGRYSGDHDLQDKMMELFTTGAPTRDAIDLVPDFGLWRHGDIDYAVFCLDDDGVPMATGSAALVRLGGLDDPSTPWAVVATSGTDLHSKISDLDHDGASSWVAAATEADLTHIWGMAVPDPLHGSAAVVAFARRDGGPATDVHWYALDVMAKALRLVLLWRHQVVRLQRAAREDPLTGLANRTGFWAELGRLDGSSDSRLLAVLYVDLDGFKEVNDEYGHAIGDVILTQVATRLRAAVRPGDHVARIGGDEFAIVAAGIADQITAERIADRVVTGLAEPFHIGADRIDIGGSVGVTTTTGDYDPDRLLDAADGALYLAKAGGRGRWALANPE